jgi:uncharacterized protein YuzE
MEGGIATMKEFRPHARFSPTADAIYVYLNDQPVAYTKELDDYRLIDYSADGAVVGIEFLGVSGGIDLSDIPFEKTVEQLIGDLGLDIKIFA